jgi:hypothetical protein
MPRNIRPAWVHVNYDGRSAPFEGGPKARKGATFVHVDIRDRGDIRKDAVTIEVRPDADGRSSLVRVQVAGRTVHEERVIQ